MKQQLGQTDIIFPVPAALIGCGDMAVSDIVTVASIGMVSSTPPTVGIALDRRRHSLELIRKTGDFTVNIPTAAQHVETDFCGITSGRKIDKFRSAGFTKAAGHVVGAPIIAECPFNMECRVTAEIPLGDYILILGEIVETHIDADKVTFSGSKPHIDIDAVNPLVYCATVREYWSIGTRLGKAFNAGKDMALGQGGQNV